MGWLFNRGKTDSNQTESISGKDPVSEDWEQRFELVGQIFDDQLMVRQIDVAVAKNTVERLHFVPRASPAKRRVEPGNRPHGIPCSAITRGVSLVRLSQGGRPNFMSAPAIASGRNGY